MKPHLQLCAGNIPVLLRKAAQRGGRVKLFSTCHTNDFKTNAKLIICGSICVVTEFPKAENLSYLPIAMDRLVNNCITMEELEESAIRQPLSAQLAFIAGRIALRTSLLENSPFPALQVPSILADKQGAPLLPLPMKGSISHKDHLAIGMGVCDFEGYIGVDLEKYRRGIEHKTMPTRRLLTQDEALRIGYMAALTADEETLVRFSLKESIYKAVHPLVGRFIGLREVEVDLSDDGSAMIRFVGPAALAPTGETSVDCKQSSAFMSRSTPDLTHLRHIEAGKYWNIAQVDKHLTIQYIAQWVKLCEQYCVTAVKVLPYRSQIRPERNIDLINNEV